MQYINIYIYLLLKVIADIKKHTNVKFVIQFTRFSVTKNRNTLKKINQLHYLKILIVSFFFSYE